MSNPHPNPEVPTPAPVSASGAIRKRAAISNNIIFLCAVCGILAGLVAAYMFGRRTKPQAPVNKPVSSPYEASVYANGIIESDQASGANVNIYPEVSGPIVQVFAHEGQVVRAGAQLLVIDDSVQRANTEQLRLQSEAALALLNELKAQPRMETLAIARAQVELAESNLNLVRNQYEKRQASHDLDPKSISKDALDTSNDEVKQAAAALVVAGKQYELLQAGAWNYEVDAQSRQYDALRQAYKAADMLLQKYSLKAPVDGVVLAINASPGSYVSPLGAFDPYTQGMGQLIVMGAPQDYLAVRCYVDEILVSRLPAAWHMAAEMSIRGTTVKMPLEFVRVQPYVSPKLQLSNQRQEKVDLRVLPVIFRFQKKNLDTVYPGQLVDVFIGQQ